jgi:molecular chaperone IbpA
MSASSKDRLEFAGKVAEAGKDAPAYLHRGIAQRAFRRTFVLAEHVRVEDAAFDKSILAIDLVREVPDSAKPRRIEIQRVA